MCFVSVLLPPLVSALNNVTIIYCFVSIYKDTNDGANDAPMHLYSESALYP